MNEDTPAFVSLQFRVGYLLRAKQPIPTVTYTEPMWHSWHDAVEWAYRISPSAMAWIEARPVEQWRPL